jgi:hypothetical protein
LLRGPLSAPLNYNLAIHSKDSFWTVQKDQASLSAVATTTRRRSVETERLLKGRNVAETIIGHIKEFSSLRLPKHRSVVNALTHIVAAIIAYQIDPLSPQPLYASVL